MDRQITGITIGWIAPVTRQVANSKGFPATFDLGDRNARNWRNGLCILWFLTTATVVVIFDFGILQQFQHMFSGSYASIITNNTRLN